MNEYKKADPKTIEALERALKLVRKSEGARQELNAPHETREQAFDRQSRQAGDDVARRIQNSFN